MAASIHMDVRSINIRALLGSGLLWAWVDALFMSSFFAPFQAPDPMAEVAAMGISLLGVPICAVFFWRSEATYRMIADSRVLIGTGFIGLVGSGLLAIAGMTGSWIWLSCGMVLCAFYMSYAIASWGAIYCRDSVRSATLYVTGGFALAFVVDLLSFSMVPAGYTVFLVLLPVFSSLLLFSVGKEGRAYVRHGGDKPVPSESPANPGSSPESHASSRRELHTSLGVSKLTIVSLVFVMVGFGYMQHLMSFSHVQGIGLTGGVAIQVVRGAVAMALFVVVLFAPKKLSMLYRVGLLAIVAGFSFMPFFTGSDYFWISGAVISGGYTVFDVLIWVVAAQASCIYQSDALKTVLILRQIINGGFMFLGSVIGILFAGLATSFTYPHPEAVFLGYLMTIAIVLLFCSKDIWGLINMRPPAAAPVTSDAGNMDARIEQLGAQWGLTRREQDIFRLLAIGRTQPWIAENQGISESTVNTHVRHVYQKAGVNSRQELLDLVVSRSDVAPKNV